MLCGVLWTILSAAALAATVVLAEDDSKAGQTASNMTGEGRRALQKASGAANMTGAGRRTYTQLLDKLLARHSALIPANADNPHSPVNVSIKMVVQSLSDLDMRSQRLTVTVWFEIEWHDPFLSWDPDLYHVDTVMVSEKLVWRPVIAVANSFLSQDQLMKLELPLTIWSGGRLQWFPGDTLLIDCKVDLRLYPFDSQTCTVQIAQWAQFEKDVNCTEATLRNDVSGHGEWDIVGLHVERKTIAERDGGYVYWVVKFRLTLQRKWLFHALNVLFPVLLVSLLIGIVFLLPVASGDKMAVSMTNFLTLAVFMTLVQDSLPQNSDTVCYLVVYLVAQLIMGGLAVVLSAIFVARDHRETRGRETVKHGPCCFQGKEGSAEDSTSTVAAPCQRQDADQLLQSFPGESGWAKASPPPPPVRKPEGHSESDGEEEQSESGWNWSIFTAASKLDAHCFAAFMLFSVLSFVIYCLLAFT